MYWLLTKKIYQFDWYNGKDKYTPDLYQLEVQSIKCSLHYYLLFQTS